jgi:hypothetical protein
MKWIFIDRWYGQNLDGSDHWDTCSKNKWDQVVATGTPFEVTTKDGKVEGYTGSVHGTKLKRDERKAIVGKGSAPSLCDCRVPPWEECLPTCKTRES